MSRTPVREALFRLDGEGLVFARGRGVRLRVLAGRELLEVFEARAALEGWAMGRVADLVGAGEIAPARLAELDQLADVTNTLTEEGNLTAATESNRLFHQAATRLAENPTVDETLQLWWDQITIATREGLDKPKRVRDVDAEHRILLAALRAGDRAAARGCAEQHALASGDLVQRRLSHPGTASDPGS